MAPPLIHVGALSVRMCGAWDWDKVTEVCVQWSRIIMTLRMFTDLYITDVTFFNLVFCYKFRGFLFFLFLNKNHTLTSDFQQNCSPIGQLHASESTHGMSDITSGCSLAGCDTMPTEFLSSCMELAH